MKDSLVFDARITPNSVGGVQTFIEGLAEGFKILNDGSFKRFWFVESGEWLSPYLSDEDEIVIAKTQHSSEINFGIEKKDSRFTNHWYKERKIDPRLPIQPIELDMIKPKIVHFFSQDAFLTNFPYIYHPHDLQHFHFPEYFSMETLGWRNLAWATYAGYATKVVCGSKHVAEDIENLWNIPKANISIIPLGTQKTTKISKQKNQNKKILFYPASYYPHKNHINLIYALRDLILDGFDVDLYLTGSSNQNEISFDDLIIKLGVDKNIKQFGHVSNTQLENLYLASDLVVVPTLYESASFPILEAQKYGVPVVCSDIEPLKSQVVEETDRFDPLRVASITACIKTKLLSNQNLGRTPYLARRWEDVCLDYLKLYRDLSK